MKKTGLTLLFTLAVFACTSMASYGQYREDLNKGDFSGPVVQKQDNRPESGSLSNLFNMQMHHSYSMTFMSFGGQYRNVNAYTNSMDFFFSDRLTGELDISLLHSPFGQGFSNTNNQMGADIVIRNAALNYQLSDKANISLEFHQYPYGQYYRGPFSNFGFGRY